MKMEEGAQLIKGCCGLQSCAWPLLYSQHRLWSCNQKEQNSINSKFPLHPPERNPACQHLNCSLVILISDF